MSALKASSRLKELEAVIESGLPDFVNVGIALEEIKRERLYLQAGYQTFDSYCRERWQFQKSRAHQQIRAAQYALSTTGTRPQTEREARERMQREAIERLPDVQLEKVQAQRASEKGQAQYTQALDKVESLTEKLYPHKLASFRAWRAKD